VQELETAWCAEIAERGYHVVGDLADLRGAGLAGDPAVDPAVDPVAWADPDRPDEAEVADAALTAISALLGEAAEAHREIDRLRAQLTETERSLERSYLRPTYRMREKVVRRLGDSTTGQRALKAYRHARRR
ncbi:MAG TPA: hypothetical protein VN088_00200, partial [Nocardioides sp.]|nr:hypothetical protein [Nocardioides sp.]